MRGLSIVGDQFGWRPPPLPFSHTILISFSTASNLPLPFLPALTDCLRSPSKHPPAARPATPLDLCKHSPLGNNHTPHGFRHQRTGPYRRPLLPGRCTGRHPTRYVTLPSPNGFRKDLHPNHSASFLIDLLPSPITTGIVGYLSLWYTREEQATRMALILAVTPFANTISGLLDFGIASGLSNIGGLGGWSWIFIFEGLFALVLSTFTFLLLSRNPLQTTWLTPTDREILLARLEQDDEHRAFSVGAGEGEHFRDARRDWKVWFYAAIALTWGISAHAMSLSLPTIVLRMGMGVETVQWMSAIPGIVATVISLLILLSSSLFKERGIHTAFAGILVRLSITAYTSLVPRSNITDTFSIHANPQGIIGYILLISFWNKDPYNQYGALIVAVTGVFAVLPILLSWVTVNIGGRAKRTIASAIILTASNVGGAIGAHLYRSESSSIGIWQEIDFERPHTISGVSLGMAVMLVAMLKALFAHENARRDRLTAEEYKREAAGHPHDDIVYHVRFPSRPRPGRRFPRSRVGSSRARF
ncbi:major facilitator superfamily domain-containing protein [Jimgerdemannia flammicorona]|uniref:Major facilitator superfamily domain-containing protein n=1 Tax=Jimgerdemannia flammicorona TaxID=994334 RepID=A0A433D045_9FUNG|nr:major facilitator superfamily domain-containing protein [Jimgerdemannia flammicorona]